MKGMTGESPNDRNDRGVMSNYLCYMRIDILFILMLIKTDSSSKIFVTLLWILSINSITLTLRHQL